MKRVFFLLSFIVCIFSIFITIKANPEIKSKVIVIDPGHGGMDSGCNYGNIKESLLNLQISKKLESVFLANGFDVVLTRNNEESLCEDSFNKKEDMSNRVEIINGANPILCISVHLNMFSDSKYRGAQVFYSNANNCNKSLANSVQSSLCYVLGNTTRDEVFRDNIFILNRAVCPSIIVECGFLSNPEERELLLSEDYQMLIAYSIYYGCSSFLVNEKGL